MHACLAPTAVAVARYWWYCMEWVLLDALRVTARGGGGDSHQSALHSKTLIPGTSHRGPCTCWF